MRKTIEEIIPIDLDDLLGVMSENVKKDIKNFEDVINLDGAINREIFIGPVGDGLGSTVDGYIKFFNKIDDTKNIPIEERKPIKIYIDSPGGNLTDAFTVIDSIKLSKTPVWTIVTGCGYSAGMYIAIAGHKRFAYPHSSFLFHEGSCQNGGTASQFENFAAFYRTQLNQLKDFTINKTKLDEDWYKEFGKEDIWFTAEEALEKGLIDEIVGELV